MVKHDGNMILVGIKINDRLRDLLDSSRASVKHFFADNNEEFLQVYHMGSYEYLAKPAKSGTSLEELSNMSMNLKTMLRLICPEFSLSDGAIKVYAFTPLSANLP